MTNLLVSDLGFYSLQRKYFFKISSTLHKTKVLMVCKNSILNTNELPTICEELNKIFPAVLTTKCFNEDNLPFAIEVKKTEIAHLFEHMLIEYIYEEKVARGFKNIKVRGVTEWNWKNEPYGTYNLSINVGVQDMEIFNSAFDKTILLFNSLLKYPTQKERQIVDLQPSVLSLV